MIKVPTGSPATFYRKFQGFLFGLIFGIVLTGIGSALWADEDGDGSFRKSVLYALAQLAIDTERNAFYIVELRQRVDHLETALERAASGND